MTSAAPHSGPLVWSALLVVIAATVQEVGAAFAVGLFAALGVSGTVFARFAIAAVILGLLVRPRIRARSRHEWASVLALAVTLVVMNVCFYEALSRIPLGIAVTVEICGPLLLSVILNRRLSGWACAVAAFAGVALLGLDSAEMSGSSAVGVMFAGGAAASWAAYILASAHAGRNVANLDALALATLLGALLTSPVAALTIDVQAALQWQILALAGAVALMCSVIPYSLELTSLRTLPAGVFAILTSLSPAVAALAGWLVLHQRLGLIDIAAMGLVCAASIGAVRSAPNRAPTP